MASPAFIGIVTVTYSSGEVLPAFIESVASQTFENFLVIAVDNASKDDTLAQLSAWSDARLRTIANPDNRGVAAGNNQGIQLALEAGCTHVLLLNNDVSFGPDLLERLLQGLERHQAQMASPKILYFDPADHIWMAGGRFEPWAGYRTVHFGENEVDRGQYDTPRLVTYVPTCCVLIKREVFDRVGLMDERYFVYSDDSDFMYRAMKARQRLIYLPDTTLLHKVGGLSGGASSPFTNRIGTRNRLFFLLKHFGLLRTLPWAGVLQLIWTLQYVTRRRDAAWYKLKQEAFQQAFKMPR